MPWKITCQKEQRWKFIHELLRRKIPLSVLSRRWGISRKTAYKWVARFEQRGRLGLADRSRAAQRIVNRPTIRWLARLRQWRRLHPHWGAPKLHFALRRRFGRRGLPSESAIGRWLKQWKLTRPRRRRSHRGPVVERPRLTVPKRANQVWTVDFKGWFRTGDGQRVDPLTVRDLFSRYILAIDLLAGGQNIADCRRAFERIFARYGLPRIIRSDNGAPFGAAGALGLTRLSAWWVKLGIAVEFITPGRPDQNGAHEHFHGLYKQETLQAAAPSLRAQKRRSEQWRQQYNDDRPHEALGMAVPSEFYRPSRRKPPRRLKPWRYPAGWPSRLVKGQGMIHFQGRGRFVGEAFEHERVGLKLIHAGVWEVYYGPRLIGQLWDADPGGIRAVWYRPKRWPKKPVK